MWHDLFTAISLLGSGIQAGALLMVLLGVCPTLLALPVPEWIRLHVALDRSIERYMPALNLTTGGTTLILVLLPQDGEIRGIRIAALACNIALAVMSELVNVRINKQVKKVSDAVPAYTGVSGSGDGGAGDAGAELVPVRARWVRWHFWRTWVITLGFGLYVLAAVLAG